MISADCPPGVVAGKLDQTVRNLRSLLDDYRAELRKSECAFEQWETRWTERSREIDAHLETIQSRLGTAPAAPTLTLVPADE